MFFSQQRIHKICLLDRALGSTLLLSPGFNPSLSWVMNCPPSELPYILAIPYFSLEVQQAQNKKALL